jgi:DNA polymerase-3 subunit beta
MEFTINKNDIIDVLSKIQGLTSRKSSLAITESLLIKTNSSSITVAATDLETGFEGIYSANIESEGIIAINSRKFYEITRDFPSEEIRVYEAENRWIEIGNQKVQYHIVGMNPEDFPDIPHVEEVDYFEIDSMVFTKMIEKTVLVTVGSDDKRTHVNGVYFERIFNQDEKKLRMVSTDGSRLSLVDCTYDKDTELPQGQAVLIPKKGLSEVSKFLKPTETILIGVKGNNFIIKKDKETMIIRLLEGSFPKYHDIIVKGEAHQIKFNRQLFLMMLKRMSILSSDDYKGVIFNFEKNKLMITTTNPDIGESKEDTDIDFDGKPMEIAFNPKYFIEMVNVIDDDHIILNIIDEEKPCQIEGADDKSFLGVIMPMRI